MNLEQLYWYFRLGKPKHRASIYDLRTNPGNYIQQPVFFLSTGRCGTKWFSELLSKDSSFSIFHQPEPSLAMQSKMAYKLFKERDGNPTATEISLVRELLWSARENHLRYTYKTGKRYVETNNYITFFAPFLLEMFPDALFIHLIRHPGDFVRSGVNRRYYTGEDSDDMKRIEPLSGSFHKEWPLFGQVAKTAWLWRETNDFILQFLERIPENQYRSFNFNHLDSLFIQDLLSFIGSSISLRKVKRLIPKKINAQGSTLSKEFKDWSKEDKKVVSDITGEIAGKLGYSLQI